MGIAPDFFWTMTPRWLVSLLTAWHEERVGQMRFKVTVAWLAARWPLMAARKPGMPRLGTVLKELGLGLEERRQTPAEMLAAGRQWAATAAAAQRQSPPSPTVRRARLMSLDRWRAAQPRTAER